MRFLRAYIEEDGQRRIMVPWQNVPEPEPDPDEGKTLQEIVQRRILEGIDQVFHDASEPFGNDDLLSEMKRYDNLALVRGPGFKAGDHVYHKPTGETWVLAADQHMGRVVPAGWPETIAYAADCELKKEATHVERIEMLRNVAANMKGIRGILARGQLSNLGFT